MSEGMAGASMAGIVEGKVIVVTGAGRGIGKEIALLAAREEMRTARYSRRVAPIAFTEDEA